MTTPVLLPEDELALLRDQIAISGLTTSRMLRMIVLLLRSHFSRPADVNAYPSLDGLLWKPQDDAFALTIDVAHVNDTPSQNAARSLVVSVREVTSHKVGIGQTASFDPDRYHADEPEQGVVQLSRKQRAHVFITAAMPSLDACLDAIDHATDLLLALSIEEFRDCMRIVEWEIEQSGPIALASTNSSTKRQAVQLRLAVGWELLINVDLLSHPLRAVMLELRGENATE